VVASPKVWFVGAWQFQLNQIEATASKCAKNRLRHRSYSSKRARSMTRAGWIRRCTSIATAHSVGPRYPKAARPSRRCPA